MGRVVYHDGIPNPHVLPLGLSRVLRRTAHVPELCGGYLTVPRSYVGTRPGGESHSVSLCWIALTQMDRMLALRCTPGRFTEVS